MHQAENDVALGALFGTIRLQNPNTMVMMMKTLAKASNRVIVERGPEHWEINLVTLGVLQTITD